MIAPGSISERYKTSNNLQWGEALIDPVHQYQGLWDMSNPPYKDQNYKDAKWMEIATILEIPSNYAFMITCIDLFDDCLTHLHYNPDYLIIFILILRQQIAAKWKSLHNQYVCCKNSSKGKSGDSLEKKPKWKFFCLTFLDVTLEK